MLHTLVENKGSHGNMGSTTIRMNIYIQNKEALISGHKANNLQLKDN